MHVLLDSCILIDLAKGKLELSKDSHYYINIIVYSEVYYGYIASGIDIKQFEQLLDYYSIEVMDLDKSVAIMYTQLKLSLNKTGLKLDDMDLLIAATCLVNNFRLYTYNMRHFSRIANLKYYDPKS